MEKPKQRELESIISSQKEQLTRYETRLKDVVTAYKGLLKEKEALEASLTAFSARKDSIGDGIKSTESKHSGSDGTAHSEVEQMQTQQKNESDIQIATLMNSLATLSAEKSRMESSFQADKKQLRSEFQVKEKMIKELQDKLKSINSTSQIELETLRGKLIVERHEREKEHNDHMVMIKELQKLLSDERHLKENLEMQLNDLKNQFTSITHGDRTIKELSNELDVTKKKLKQYEANNGSGKSNATEMQSSAILKQLQSEMNTMKQNHAIAIKNEQKRAHQAEEHNKKLSSIHEERVANLESRLAELSATVGNYDRLRHQDQENILKLKEKIAQLVNTKHLNTDYDFESQSVAGGDGGGSHYSYRKNFNSLAHDDNIIDELINEILHLKSLLIIENNKLDEPRDLTKVFILDSTHQYQTSTATAMTTSEQQHSICKDELNKMKLALERTKNDNEQLAKENSNQKHHIKTLQDKVKVLNYNIDEQENELKIRVVEFNNQLRQEKGKFNEAIGQIENDYRNKIGQLENQLSKQRDRSLLMLEEKENEIKALKTSYDIFLPTTNQACSGGTAESVDEHAEQDGEPVVARNKKHSITTSQHLSTVLNHSAAATGNGNSASDAQFHMLHYVHDLARKDVEISALRKAKHSAETALRQALQDKISSQEDLHNKISVLEEHVDRLERNKSREGENLEYLKNVILSFLITNDADSKRHMLNAIGAVLKFNPSEIKQLNKIFFKKAPK